MQELYLVQGDLSVQQNSIEGYPKAIPSCGTTTNFCTTDVTLPANHTYERVFYRLTTSSGTQSNEIEVQLPKHPTALPTADTTATVAEKVLHRGQIYIRRAGKCYDTLGRPATLR